MKQRVCIILAAWLIAAFAALLVPGVQAGDVPRITKEELKQKLCTPDLILLDVRVAGSWEKSNQKIKCAQRVDPDKVAAWEGTLPKNKEIVIYCS
jgi:rhodanese-related sulfurtransferase